MNSKNFQILDLQPIENKSKSNRNNNDNVLIEVFGVSEYICKPDICILNIHIENVKTKAIEAKQAVLKRMLYAKQCVSSFHVKAKNFSDFVSLDSCENGYKCYGIIVLKLTDFKIAQEIANLLIEKLEHSVKIEFKLERSEEALRDARQRSSTGAVSDAKLKAQSMIGSGKLTIVSVKQVEEVERPFISCGANKDLKGFHWTAEIDDKSLIVSSRVQASFTS